MLEIKEIYKTFNKGTVNEKHALNGVNLTLNEGDFCTVIGGNGAGKSTFLKILSKEIETTMGYPLLTYSAGNEIMSILPPEAVRTC